MRLNGSALNRRRLNGGRRLPVLGSGQAVAQVLTSLAATRVVHGAGDSAVRLQGEFLASAIRHADGQWEHSLGAELAQTVVRNGVGHAVLEVGADLYYSRVVQGFGAALIELELQGHVGVVFIEGSAVIRPMQVELDGAKRVVGSGTAQTGLQGRLAASAIRRVTAAAAPIRMEGGLEASHIDAGGVRHIGFAGAAPIALIAQDGGMIRQAFIGSLDFELQGVGRGSLIKPTLAGEAVTTLGMACDFHVKRRFEGSAAVRLLAEAAGAILVRGEGRAVLSLLAQATGYKRTFPQLAASITSIDTELDGARVALGQGSTRITLDMEATGVRRRLISGEAVIEVLAESDAYLNPNAEDPAEETFARPDVERAFSRPESVREWRR
ncbi:hypothetical protein IB234_15300 [Pseudomonas sp. PDM16]|uniref:hypothetical protein n=1 Tax=Pseudomonas sp. PDM16 TaxID=2769292 RepID=UPI001786F6F8|nr:hypothetical protein [Pseudomonas sp. PDM16]MBD9415928.1 hypothetical protein [Pseudomonas sp. PDM16]